MVDKPNMDPNKKVSGSAQPPDAKDPSAKSKGDGSTFQPPATTFLGMHFDKEQAKQLWSVLIQSINTQISHNKDRALAALKKIKESNEEDG